MTAELSTAPDDGEALVLPAATATDVAQVTATATDVAQVTATATDVAQVTAAWLASRRSVHTRRAYTADLDGWLRWCAVTGLDPLAVRRRHVQVWVAQLHADGAAPSTTARKLATVSGWYRALAGEDLVAVVPTLEVQRAPVDVDDSAVLGLDQAAAVALLRTAAADSPRAHALVVLLLVRALRVAEALALDVPDVVDTVRGHRVAKVAGKGGQRRLAALPPAVSRAVDVLVDGRTEGALFVTRTGARWVASEAYRTVRRLARDAGVPNPERVHPHALRHTAVTLALDSGANLVDVQDMAGHADPRTTRRYDRARGRLDRDPSYALAALLDGS